MNNSDQGTEDHAINHEDVEEGRQSLDHREAPHLTVLGRITSARGRIF